MVRFAQRLRTAQQPGGQPLRHIDRLTTVKDWTVTKATAVRDRLRLTWIGLLAVLSAIAAVLAAGVVLVAVSQDVFSGDGLQPHDASNLDAVISHRSDPVIAAARMFTQAGGIAVLIVVAVASAAFLWFLCGERVIIAVAPLLSLAAAGGCVGVAKHLVARARPPAALHLVPESDASFPSGHASDATALYVAVAMLLAVVVFRRPAVRVLTVAVAFAGAAAVGASRLILGVHYPTDVIVGWALGAVVAITVTTVTVLIARQPAPPADDTDLRAVWPRVHRLLAANRRALQAARIGKASIGALGSLGSSLETVHSSL